MNKSLRQMKNQYIGASDWRGATGYLFPYINEV